MISKLVERGESTEPKLVCPLTARRYLFHFAKKVKRNFFKSALSNANHSRSVPPAGRFGHHAVVLVVMVSRHDLFEVPGFIHAILSLIMYYVVLNESW